MKKIFFLLFLALTTLLPRKQVLAIVDPLETTNNKFGIHIIDENDLDDAAKLVNSNGGEWGYVTMVIAEKDRDKDRIQNMFNRMRELKLIPIIRLATRAENGVWIKPEKSQAIIWAGFLDSLNWVIKNRYVIIFNEPNQDNEWGADANPQEYAQIARVYQETLKNKNQDFFILPAGLDAGCSNTDNTIEITSFFDQMTNFDPKIFTIFDGFTSHSYPNPGFSGSVYDYGKGTIRSYLFETNYLKKYGLSENIPVFITETGWIHSGNQGSESFNSPEKVASLFKKAYQSVWIDKSIVAITPFLLNYQDFPFENFSWKKKASSDFYPQFGTIQSLLKIKGAPIQENKISIKENSFPKSLKTDLLYPVKITITNIGQTIWPEKSKLSLNLESENKIEIEKTLTKPIKPFEKIEFNLILKAPSFRKTNNLSLSFEKDGEVLGEAVNKILQTTYFPKFFSKILNSFQKKQDPNTIIDLDYLFENKENSLSSNLFLKTVFARL